MQAQNKILAIDDNPDNAAIVEELFGEHYDLRTAATGQEALDITLDFVPDIILLDIMLPDIDGYEVCRRLRQRPSLSDTTIIMVTAKGALEDKIAGYEAGADDYITKPFEEEDILGTVEFFCKLRPRKPSTESLSQMRSKDVQYYRWE